MGAHCPQGAHRAFAFGSGMAALSTVVRLVPSGGHIVAGRDLYGGTSRLLARVVPNLGITVSHVDTANPAYDPSCPACLSLLIASIGSSGCIVQTQTAEPITHPCDNWLR